MTKGLLEGLLINRGMRHYTYLTTNLDTFEFYVGVRSCKCDPEDDPYLGSGVRISNSVRKHGRSKFFKRVLKEFATRELAKAEEASHVTKSLLALPGCLNLILGGGGYTGDITLSEKERRSKAVKAAWAVPGSKEMRGKAISAGNKSSTKMKATQGLPETKAKISLSLKNALAERGEEWRKERYAKSLATKQAKLFSDPEWKAKWSAKCKETWAKRKAKLPSDTHS